MRNAILFALFLLALTPPARAQSVAYEKYRLDNGLTIILHEDHKLPIAAVNLWYRVGAQNEPKGRSGFAHLFEHLMFMGTERVPGSDFDNIMEAGGGSNNASTSLDRTNYFSSGPSSLLPTLLWLDADRMEDLGRTMTREKLDRQRDVVRNEIRQQVENTPYGRMEDYINRFTYPEGHPYHWNVYGLHEDLEAADVDNVRNFFATFYVPNNCSLVVAGDFDSAGIKPLIKSLFGDLRPGLSPSHPTLADFPLPQADRQQTLTMLDKVDLPRIRYAYHTPPHFSEGDADLDLVAGILADGHSSRLYKRLVLEEKLAADVTAAQDSAVLGSQFFIDITANPDADLDRVQSITDQEIARLAEEGPTEPELEQRKAAVELGSLARVESLLTLADRLNEYEYAFGEPNSFKRDLDRYRAATTTSVRRWAGWLVPTERTVVRCLPEKPDRAASAREKRPPDSTAGPFSPPAPEHFSLAGGLSVLFWPRTDVPLVSVEVVLPSGSTSDAPEKSGLSFLTCEMLGEGAGERDSVQFADAVQSLGATFTAAAGRESTSASLTVLKRNFAPALQLFADALRRPRLAQPDFERVKRIHLEELDQDLNDPTIVAQRVFLRALFGDSHPYAWPTEGTSRSVESLTLSDVKSAFASSITPAGATLLISGDLTAAEARAALEQALGDWAAAPSHTPPALPSTGTQSPPAKPGLRVFLVHREGAVQTVVRFAAPAPTSSDPLRVRLSALETLFGGSFTSRLNRNIREEHGYAYGARAGYQLARSTGYFAASSSVKADTTGPALSEFLKEFGRLRGGPLNAAFVAAPQGDITAAELAKAAQTIRTETIQTFQGHAGPLHAAAERLAAGLTYDTITQDLAALDSLSIEQLNTMARDATPLERGVLLLVGDRAVILEQIKNLGLPAPVELSPTGDPVR